MGAGISLLLGCGGEPIRALESPARKGMKSHQTLALDLRRLEEPGDSGALLGMRR